MINSQPTVTSMSCPDHGALFHNAFYVRVGDNPGVISWCLESKCRIRPLLRAARFTSCGGDMIKPSRDGWRNGKGVTRVGLQLGRAIGDSSFSGWLKFQIHG